MSKKIIAKKMNMSQTFLDDGSVVPFTWLKVEDKHSISVGDKVTVTGTSKGKGFAGVMKRHGFRGGPATHGQSDRARAPGSIGGTTTVSRVLKGKKMPGKMGNDTITLKNRSIIIVEDNKVGVKGPVPGSFNSKIKLVVNKAVDSNES